MRILTVFLALLPLALAQSGQSGPSAQTGQTYNSQYWNSATSGKGSSQAEAYRQIAAQTQREVFVLLPALYNGVADQLLALAASGKSVRVVVQSNGLKVSNGLSRLRGRVEVRVVGVLSGRPDAKGLIVVDQHVLFAGTALWDSRQPGWRWQSFPAGMGGSMLDQLRLLWQGAKPV